MRKIIVIDPGHGGKDPGAVGSSGLRESDVAFRISIMVVDFLNRYDIDAILTRSRDQYVSLQDRAKLANNEKADYFISIHINSASNPLATGTETFAFTNSVDGTKLATSIQNKLINEINLANRGVKYADFYVLKYTNMPAALVEVAFINNPYEEKLLMDDLFLEHVAVGISNGILEHLGIDRTIKLVYSEQEVEPPEIDWREEQGLKHLSSLVDKNIIDSPDFWKDKLLEGVPVWAMLSLLDRMTGNKK